MATDLHQGFDFRWLGTATIDWVDASGAHAVSFSSGQYAHLAMTAVDPKDRSGSSITTGFSAFAAALQTAMDAATAQTVTVAFNASTLAYTIAVAAGTIALTLTGSTARDKMRRILGFTGNKGAAASQVSDMRPWYVVRATIDGRTSYDQSAVRDDQIVTARAEDGRLYALGPTRLVRQARWEHHFEPKAAVHSRFAVADTLAGGASWTWEDWLNHAARYGVPCVAKDATESMVFYTSKPFGRQSFRRRQRDIDPQQIVTIDAESVIGYL